MAWRSMIPNQISTRLSHDPEVGVKWMWILGFAVPLQTFWQAGCEGMIGV
jgi:hypothetical protein